MMTSTFARERATGARHVAGVVCPDVVASLRVKALHRGDCAGERIALRFVVDAMVVQREHGVFVALDVLCDIAHERVECFRSLDEAYGEGKFGVVLVVDLNGDFVVREEVAGAIAELERVSHVYGHGDGCVGGGFDGASGCQHIGGAGEMDGDGVDVDAYDGITEFAEHLGRVAFRTVQPLR